MIYMAAKSLVSSCPGGLSLLFATSILTPSFPSSLCRSYRHQWISSPVTVAMEHNILWNNKTSSFHNQGTISLTLKAEMNVTSTQTARSAQYGQSKCSSLSRFVAEVLHVSPLGLKGHLIKSSWRLSSTRYST